MSKIDFEMLCAEWKRQHGSPVIARSEVKKFSGGLISPGYLANLDSQGKGPAGRFRVGRKTAYRVDELCRWIMQRIAPSN